MYLVGLARFHGYTCKRLTDANTRVDILFIYHFYVRVAPFLPKRFISIEYTLYWLKQQVTHTQSAHTQYYTHVLTICRCWVVGRVGWAAARPPLALKTTRAWQIHSICTYIQCTILYICMQLDRSRRRGKFQSYNYPNALFKLSDLLLFFPSISRTDWHFQRGNFLVCISQTAAAAISSTT